MTLDRLMQSLRDRLSRGRRSAGTREVLLGKYEAFKTLMAANNAALGVIADMQAKATGEFLFDMKYVSDVSGDVVGYAGDVVDALAALSEEGQPRLAAALSGIREDILGLLEVRIAIPPGPLAADMDRIADLPVEAVGAKNHNLARIRRALSIPVPDGFSVTSAACLRFLTDNRLLEGIRSIIEPMAVSDKSALSEASARIRGAVLAAPWPEDVARTVEAAFDDLVERTGRPDLLVSVRSSAVGEDGEFSFAGQYTSVLNVARDGLLQACKEVLASQFGPRAVVYYKARGVAGWTLPMAIGVIAMVDARASGVLYTRPPDAAAGDVLTIAGHWGLGRMTVEGEATPDVFTVAWDEEAGVTRTKVALKERMLLCREGRGLVEVDVPGWMRRQPCLTRVQAETLAVFGRRLEAFYGVPQDVEWALDANDELLILQSRPLRLPVSTGPEPEVVEARKGLTPVLSSGSVASRGVAAGRVCRLSSLEDVDRIPEGAVLVTRTASPELARAIDRIAALVAETGSVASHLATVAREFDVPAIVGVGDAASALADGREVTVDADMGNVYDGRIEALLKSARPSDAAVRTPVVKRLRAVLEHVAPLNLTDPRSRRFRPSGCRTVHDVLRYAHETAVREMFLTGDAFSKDAGRALKLESPMPVDFYFIDLGGGLAPVEGSARTVAPGHFVCAPLKALWAGMADVPWDTAPAAGGRGVASVMMTALTSGDMAGRMAEPNFVLVTDAYLNMNFRLGYHFSRVDAYLSEEQAENYASFLFHGGAADAAGRARRVSLISEVLKARGWAVESRGDALFSRTERLPAAAMREELTVLGRLLVATRQIDTLLADDDALERAVEAFRAGRYDLAAAGERED